MSLWLGETGSPPESGENKMTKKELRAQLLNDTLAFVMQGNAIQEVPAQKVKIKHIVRGKASNTAAKSAGMMPEFKISSLYHTDL